MKVWTKYDDYWFTLVEVKWCVKCGPHQRMSIELHRAFLTHCGLVMSYGDWVNTGSGNGLLLTVPGHYQDHGWLIISKLHRLSYEDNFAIYTSAINHYLPSANEGEFTALPCTFIIASDALGLHKTGLTLAQIMALHKQMLTYHQVNGIQYIYLTICHLGIIGALALSA